MANDETRLTTFAWQSPMLSLFSSWVQSDLKTIILNPLSRVLRSRGPTIAGMRPGNADRWTMHAEIAAMLQALDAGLRGGQGRLTVRGVSICPWCKGDIKTLARTLQLQSLPVIDHDGTIMEFREPSDFYPVKQGGKA